MNREELIMRLKAFPYDPKDYYLLFETAKVMRGLAAGIGAIRLGCSKEFAERLLADGIELDNPDGEVGKRNFKVDRDFYIRETKLFEKLELLSSFEWIEGFQVPTVEDMKAVDDFTLLYWGMDPDSMLEYCTDHYVFHYSKGSMAERDIVQIAEKQEAGFRRICDALKVEPDFPVECYLLDSLAQMARIEGRPVGGCFHAPNMVFVVYNGERRAMGPHEDAHLVSWLIGDPCTAVQEGLAMWFDRGYNGADNLSWTVWFLHKGMCPSIDDLITRDDDHFHMLDERITYPVMGIFTAWLIAGAGMERYLEFYKYKDSAEGFRKVYGRSAAELNELFVKYVKQFQIKEGGLEQMENLFSRLDELP